MYQMQQRRYKFLYIPKIDIFKEKTGPIEVVGTLTFMKPFPTLGHRKITGRPTGLSESSKSCSVMENGAGLRQELLTELKKFIESTY